MSVKIVRAVVVLLLRPEEVALLEAAVVGGAAFSLEICRGMPVGRTSRITCDRPEM